MKESNAINPILTQNNQNLDQLSEDQKLRLFLDFLIEEAQRNPDLLIPYTEEMSQEWDELLEGII